VIRERIGGTITARAGIRRLLADSCCQAVLISLTLWLISALNTEAIAGPSRQLLIQEVALAAILACALAGYEQIAALGGLAALAALGPLGAHAQLVWLAKSLIPITCLLVMVRAPQKRPRDRRRLLCLLPISVLAALHAGADVGLAQVLAIVSVGGLLRLYYDPRLAIACSLVWIFIIVAVSHTGQPGPAGAHGLLVILAFTAAGLMLTLAAGRLWIIRHIALKA
jgi:hypothetical protein